MCHTSKPTAKERTSQSRTGAKFAGTRAFTQTDAGWQVPDLDELPRASTVRQTTAANHGRGVARVARTWQRTRGHLPDRCFCRARAKTANEIDATPIMTSKLLTLTLLSARSAAGTLLVKITCNVSRNDALATLDPFGAESAQFWTDYVRV